MRRTISYPVAFEAEVPRHRETKTVLAFETGEVDIPEISSDDAPVVITVHDIDQLAGVPEGTEYRFHGDRLLVDTGISATGFGSDESASVEQRGSLILPALEAMRKTFGFGEGFHLYPPKAPLVLSNLIWNGGVPEDLQQVWKQMAEAGRLERDESAHETAMAWRRLTVDHAASFAVIDGSVWKETAEPCYTVTPDLSPGLTTRPADFYSRLRTGLMDSSQWSTYRVGGRNFSALDRQRAYRHGTHAAQALGLEDDANLPRIDVRTPDIPLIDFETHEFERVSRLLVHDVADAFRKLAHGRGVDFFYSVPENVMRVFLAARDSLVGMDAREGISLDQEKAVQALVDELNSAVGNGQPYLVRMDLREVNEIFEDWLSREVFIPAIVAPSSRGGPK